MLAKITDIFGKAELNILQQVNHSKGTIAYNVIDCSIPTDGSVLSLKELQKDITMLNGVLSSRVLFGKPGAGYAVQRSSEYYVLKLRNELRTALVVLSEIRNADVIGCFKRRSKINIFN